MNKKQIVIWNLVAFGVIHFILEVALGAGTRNPNNITLPVIVQYFISWWIIKPQIESKDKKSLIKYTWIVALSVFAVRVLLGLMLAGM